jgi:hypothetical protein
MDLTYDWAGKASQMQLSLTFDPLTEITSPVYLSFFPQLLNAEGSTAINLLERSLADA